MHAIDLVFTADPSWFSRAVRWFTEGQVSHVMIEYTSGVWGGRWVAESSAFGVRKVLAESRRRHVAVDYRFVQDISPSLGRVAHLVGAPYDVGSMLWLAYASIYAKLFRRRVTRPSLDTRAQMCSEFVARVIQDAGYPGTEAWNPEEVTPDQLRQYCADHPDLFEHVKATV